MSPTKWSAWLWSSKISSKNSIKSTNTISWPKEISISYSLNNPKILIKLLKNRKLKRNWMNNTCRTLLWGWIHFRMLRKYHLSSDHLGLISMGLGLLTNCVLSAILISSMERQSDLMGVMAHYGIRLSNSYKTISIWALFSGLKSIPNSSKPMPDKMPEQTTKLSFQWWSKTASRYFQTLTLTPTTYDSWKNTSAST